MEIIQTIIELGWKIINLWIQGAWAFISGIAIGLWNNPIILIILLPMMLLPKAFKKK